MIEDKILKIASCALIAEIGVIIHTLVILAIQGSITFNKLTLWQIIDKIIDIL